MRCYLQIIIFTKETTIITQIYIYYFQGYVPLFDMQKNFHTISVNICVEAVKILNNIVRNIKSF